MPIIVEKGKNALVEEETLSDGSKVYNVLLGEFSSQPLLRIACCNRPTANALHQQIEDYTVSVNKYE